MPGAQVGASCLSPGAIASEAGGTLTAVSSPLTFDELELPVLRWSLALPAFAQVELLRGEPAEGLPNLTGDQVDDALRRLARDGLVAGRRFEGSGAFHWDGPRPTAQGLRVLGQWPPTEEASLQEVLAAALHRLAEELPDEGQASVVRRAGSGVARMAGGVAEDTAKAELRRIAGEVVGGEGGR